jgi:ABC-type Fe3+ transport system permease subunit
MERASHRRTKPTPPPAPTRPVPTAILWQPRLARIGLAMLALLLILPLLLTLVLGAQETATTDPFAGPFGPAAWWDFIATPDIQLLFLRSLGLAILVGVMASLLALAPAYLIAVIGGTGRQLLLILCLIVLLGDQVTVAMGWSEIGRQLARSLFDAEPGLGRDLLADLMTLGAETHRALPLVILSQSWALRRLDPALIEAGLECGADHFRLLRSVAWPVLRPGLAIGFCAAFGVSLGAALEPALLNTGALSWGESLRQAIDIDGNWPAAARFTILGCVVLVLLLIAAAFLLASPPRRPQREALQDRPPDGRHRPNPQDPVAILSLLALAFLASPLLWMLVLSLRYLFIIFVTAGPHLFIEAIGDDPHLLPSVVPSLVSALVAALLAGCGGAGLAALWRRLLASQPIAWHRWLLVLLSTLPFMMPSLFLSTTHLVAQLFLATYLSSGLGVIAVACADAIRAMPVAALIMLAFWRRLPRDLDETTAEFLLPTDRLRRQIIRPGLQPGWAIALAVAGMLSLSDFQLANALSGERPMLASTLLAGIATQRSPIYLALIGPLLILTGWACHLILRRLDRRTPIRAPQGSTGGFSMNITARKT